MGIYDRDYYRNEGSGLWNALLVKGSVVNTLIVANVIMFVIQLATKETPSRSGMGTVTDLLDLLPSGVVHGQIWRLLTATFLHSMDWMHIVFNMLILWWAGRELEEVYGSKEFLAFYLSAAVFSSIVFVVWQLLSGSDVPALGASGAVTAVLMLFAMHFPKRTVYFMWFFPMPVIVLVLLSVLQDTLGLLGGGRRPVAFAAHLGGAAFGFLYYQMKWRITGLTSLWKGSAFGRSQPKLRVYRGESEEPNSPPWAVSTREKLEAELDAVLEKVARDGKNSLTPRENDILLRASEVYRNRRK